MSSFKIFIILLIFVAAIRCDFSFGGCKNIVSEPETFKLDRYLGKWYELGRSKTIPFEKGDCNYAIYSLNDDGTVKVYNTEVVNGEFKGVVGKAEKTENPFKLTVSFSDSLFAKLNKGNYHILDTDYDSFAVIYSCTNLFVAKVEFYWILSRTPEVSQEKLEELFSYVDKKINKQKSNFHITDHSENACRLD